MGLAGMTQDAQESHVPLGQQLEARWDIPESLPSLRTDPAQTVAGLNQNKQIHAEFFYLVLMRSAAYKALQERATSTACSQATLPLYCLAEIQFFQSFPKWHGVKFVVHHLCPHSLVTACTLWHGKQSDPNLLPVFEIRRSEGSWCADGSTWCCLKTRSEM